MVLKFSQRQGYQPIRVDVQVETIDDPLRNALWSILFRYFFEGGISLFAIDYFHATPPSMLAEHLWVVFFNQPVDTFSTDSFPQTFRKYFFESEWYCLYDCIEALLDLFDFASSNPIFSRLGPSIHLVREINSALERHMSAYRLVCGQISPITSSYEIDGIEQALLDTSVLGTVNAHLSKALEKWSDRKKPDYRNSVKESISSVEAMCRIIVGESSMTLGAALKRLKNHGISLPSAMEKSWHQMYGYTSDQGGIRHSLTDGAVEVSAAEAQYMLVCCSAFVSYLIQLANDAGIDLNKASKPCPKTSSLHD